MKNDWRFSSLAIVLLLQLGCGYAINVYQNNEYEVSDIDKRLDIPHPTGQESHLHNHHHNHHHHHRHGLKRHRVTTVLDTPTEPNGGLLFRRQEVPVPEELTPSHHHHHKHQRHSRGFKRTKIPQNEFVFALPIEPSTEVLYRKSDIPTAAAHKKSSVSSEDGGRVITGSDKEVARHEIGFADDLASLSDLVHQAERHIEQSRSSIAAKQHPGTKRQEIIHALDEGKAKAEPEDDIEALGRRMDETGSEIKDAKYEQTPIAEKHAAAATRYIISKIQEIQDKLFKRTGNKELEDKLNQMALGDKSKKKESAAITLIQNTTAAEAAPTNSSPVVNNTVSKDKTQTAERRKIIPEEVVDKILEKFQQLKKEAKHMAVSKSRHSVEHATLPLPAPEVIEKKAEEENPYAQIGKPTKETKKDNVTETTPQNRDKLPESISRLLSAKDTKIGTIQLPIGSFTNTGGAAGSKTGPIPIMFIKSQGRLVPVFDSPDNAPIKQASTAPTTTEPAASPVAAPQPAVASPKMTVTADARAQLDGTAGVADANPNLVSQTPLEQPKSFEQPLAPRATKNMRFTMADHLLDKLNSDAGLAQPSSASMPSGYLANFQSIANKESESSRAKQLSMAESLLDRLNVNSGVAQPNLLLGGSPPQANFLANGFERDQSNLRSPSIPEDRETDSGRSRDLSTPDQLLDKLNVNSGVAQPNMMPSNLMSMFSTLMQPGRKEMQKYRNNFGIDNQFQEMTNERIGEGRSGRHRGDEEAYSRCTVPNIDCDSYQTKLRHKGEDKYDNPDIPSTEDIIQNVLHSPDFPSVAARILHNSVIKDDRKDLPVLNKYSDEDMEEHFSRGEREKSREWEREREREEEREKEREKEKEEEEEKEDRDARYERLHRHKGKARHSLADAASGSPRGDSPEELLKHMMEQLPSSSRSMDQGSPNGPITSFFNSGTGSLSHLGQADDIISSPPSPQELANQADALRDRLNVKSLQDPSARNNMQGLNPGQIQFNMQHNLAPSPIGEPSMIDSAQSVPLGTGGPIPDPPPLKLPPDSFAGAVSGPPISDDLQRQMGITNMETLQVNPTFNAQNPVLSMLSSRGTSRNHISSMPGIMPPPLGANEAFVGPATKMDFPEQEQLSAETPDQLLEYAKQKAFRQQVQSTRFDRLGHDSKDSDSEMMDSDTDTHLPILSSHLPLNTQKLSKDPTQLLDLIHSPFNNIPDGEVGQSRSNVHPEISAASSSDISNLPLGNAPFDLPIKAADAPMKPVSSDASRYEHSPDVLLEQLRKQRDKDMGIGGNYVDPVTFTKYKKARYMEDYAKSRGEIPSAVDPSLADFINGPDDGHTSAGQRMEIQSHSIASSDKRNSQYALHQKHRSLSNQVDILPGDIVQYNHGKMSSDPANVIASFFKDNNFNYRNEIPRYRNTISRPENITTNPDGSINRASIIRTLPHSHVELRINGKKFSRNENQRRDKMAGPSNNPNGETIFSKGPVKLELSHADDRSKIVNIITSAPYNVTDDRKRTHIAKLP